MSPATARVENVHSSGSRARRLLALCVAALALGGCSRESYREDADEQVLSILAHETRGTPWEVPEDFSVYPPPESRLHDPSDPDYPVLPEPFPDLYEHELDVAAQPPPVPPGAPPPGAPPPGAPPPAVEEDPAAPEGPSPSTRLAVQAIPEDYWETLPPSCLARMLEFESVREEYERQFDEPPPPGLRDPAPSLTLEDIFHQALLDSREYQSETEVLYAAALALTFERFEYFPKFTPSGNGADADWTQVREDGETVESSAVNSGLFLDALLVTGGRLLAGITNNLVLTFDGPEGFSRRVGSEILVSLSQSILQRDIRLNPLIQAERNLVYAARSFARFRKVFFFDIASRYYGILQNYRNVEIESQNYFSLVRTFEQAQAELRAGVRNAPNPVAVDQFEQGMLSGRSSLISTCNRLEQSLDSLKLAVGIPTETPIDIDLAELEELTLRDTVEVAAERVRRWLQRVEAQVDTDDPDRAEIINADVFLLERFLDLLSLVRALAGAVPEAAESEELETLLERLRLEQARLETRRMLDELESATTGERAPPILIYERTDDLIEALIALLERQVAFGRGQGAGADWLEETRSRIEGFREHLETLRERIAEILQDLEAAGLDQALADATALREDVEEAIAQGDEALGLAGEDASEEERLQRTLEWTERVVELTTSFLESFDLGLPPVGIEVDDAMRTALVRRFDLMNERGRLADDRRNIKLAADDLRSVIDLEADYAIRTRENKPLDFTPEESRAEVALSVDLPLNRRAQRNDYRRAILAYQAGRRSLMALEDTIKFEVRDDLRQLEETRLQYPISVTQAALAAEQVISVRLQLALGVEGVRGTDLLDALQSSREALIAVANRRIGYIVDRAEFALDLEIMDLDGEGFWREIDDPGYQPRPAPFPPEGVGPPYGTIPDYLLVSPEIRAIGQDPETGGEGTDEVARPTDADVETDP